ncbi:MAG: hypothetical protein KBD78_06750 [Oligoflexales bacterium]|nr:hypothetical protein [Oligoflexales bacterium]
MNNQLQQEQLKKQICTRIKGWLEEKQQRNLVALSKRSGVPYPTLKRMEFARNLPTLETLIPLLPFLYCESERHTVLSKFFPSCEKILNSIYSEQKKTNDL